MSNILFTQSGPGNDDNETVLRIPQSSRITETSPLDCLVSYPGHLFGVRSSSSTEIQSVYSTHPAKWYLRRKWIWPRELKSWSNLFAFHIALIFLQKLGIPLYGGEYIYKSIECIKFGPHCVFCLSKGQELKLDSQINQSFRNEFPRFNPNY